MKKTVNKDHNTANTGKKVLGTVIRLIEDAPFLGLISDTSKEM